MPSDSTSGKVYLVGAGPGDPQLITLRGARCLARADVVLYDYLANSMLLQHAPAAAEAICLGKHGGSRIWSQDEINDYMIQAARQGKTVVRLKGGDPVIFGRLAEEVDALAENEIPFEIVPGITTALAAGSYAGIPITHRDYASAVALITGHETDDKGEPAIDYDALARFPGTLVIYMGVTTAKTWTDALLSAGKSPHAPAAIIRHCSRPDQLTIHCTLGEVAGQLAPPSKIRPPVIVVIGEVARVAPTFSWFDKRPLFGQTVLVTRPEQQAGVLHDCLAELGANVLIQPAIEISPPADWTPVDHALSQLAQFDWLVFSSANGVEFFFQRLLHHGHDLRSVGHVKLAAIGPKTAEALFAYHLTADVQPAEFRAEALAGELINQAAGKRFLYPHASRGRVVLQQELIAAGAAVEEIVVYHSTDVTRADDTVSRQLRGGEIEWITVTSSAIARSLVNLFGDDLRKSKLASISPVTSEAIRAAGYEPSVEAKEYTMEGIVAAILAGA